MYDYKFLVFLIITNRAQILLFIKFISNLFNCYVCRIEYWILRNWILYLFSNYKDT